MLVFYLIFVLIAVNSAQKAQNYQKYDVIGWDWYMKGFVMKSNGLRKTEGLPPIFYNLDLMKLAQIEAESLASVKSLKKPVNLSVSMGSKKILGQSSQVLGFIRATNGKRVD